MATKLFKDGASVWVEAERVANYLASGYSAQDPNGPKVSHPDIILPVGMGLEKLSPAEQETAILKEMGIENLTALNPVNRSPKPEPISVVGEVPRQKRKYTRRN